LPTPERETDEVHWMLESIDRIVALADKVGLVIVEVAGQSGVPMIACARRLLPDGADQVALDDWCAPSLAERIQSDGRLTVVVWDEATGSGYHLWGACVECRRVPTADSGRLLRIRIEQVVPFGGERGAMAEDGLTWSVSA